jgi:exopolyphosphatase
LNARLLTETTMTSATEYPTVTDFLEQAFFSAGSAINRIAIGNPAGDADSIISSIGSAYIDTVLRQTPTVPVLSIPLQDLQALRPESKYLLSLAGVTILNNLVSIIDEDNLPEKAMVTLVDHNQFVVSSKNQWSVQTILDHHVDEEAHQDSCKERMVAFDKDLFQALVASTCTLVVERWQKFAPGNSPMPATLAILLLGVILIDSINLLPKAGKVTQRDVNAVKFLRETTDWSQLPLPLEVAESCSHGPDNTKLFETLQSQKFRASFWSGLTASQALKLDYKSFTVSSGHTFGVSSVLQSMAQFLEKPDVYNGLLESFFPECDFIGIMFMTIENDKLHRQLLLASPDETLTEALVQHLEADEALQPTNINRRRDSTGLHVVQMGQGNAMASRKQVAPILMEFCQKRGERR